MFKFLCKNTVPVDWHGICGWFHQVLNSWLLRDNVLFGLCMVCSLPLCCLPIPPKVWNNSHVNHVVLSGTITATTSQFPIPRCQYLEWRIPCAAHQHCHHIVDRCKDGKEYAVKTNLDCDRQYLEYTVPHAVHNYCHWPIVDICKVGKECAVKINLYCGWTCARN